MKIGQKENYLIIQKKIAVSKEIAKILEEIDPKLLETFELQEFLGEGSESQVYKAFMKISKRTVAMKMIRQTNTQRKNMNEIKITKKLKNKNINNFFVAGEFKKNALYCIITDYAKYGNLWQFIKNIKTNNCLSESLICFITYQILNGLKYCNLCKIAHFDLKPQNIIVDDNFNVKIIDFSVSLDYNKINSNEIKLSLIGTSPYMAPEVIRKQIISVNDLNKIDLYSLGVTLYKLAFNSYPFSLDLEDITNLDKFNENIMKELKIKNANGFYSIYFINFIQELLEKDISKRININQALNNYWVKGAKILFEEREKICDDFIFLNYLLYSHFYNFENYIKRK